LNRNPTLLVIGAAAAALAVAGCGGGGGSSSSSASSTPAATSTPAPASGGGSSSSSSGGGSKLSIAAVASGALKFNKSSLSAKAGKVTITMANPSPVQHGVAITGNGVQQTGQTVSKGGTSTVTVSLKPGKYTFYCPVPGHRAAGMEGTLTVK
jgi:plastocyanin